jgi:predicted NBD/HSP70 family sugar kinase
VSNQNRGPYSLGITVRPELLCGLAVDIDGEVIDGSWLKVEFEPSVEVKETVGRIAAFVDQVLDRSPQLATDLVGLGGAMNGHVGLDGEAVVFSPAFNWHDLPLASMLREATGIPRVVLQNDVLALASAESSFGVGRERSSFAVLTCRTGIGCALVLNNEVLRPPDGSASELGHIEVEPNGRLCNCRKRGCLQTVATPWILREELRSAGVEAATSEALVELAGNGHPQVRERLREAGEALGRGLSVLANVVNPGLVVIYGDDAVLKSPYFLDPAREMLEAKTFPTIKCEILVKRGDLPMKARGAASEVMQFVNDKDTLPVRRRFS